MIKGGALEPVSLSGESVSLINLCLSLVNLSLSLLNRCLSQQPVSISGKPLSFWRIRLSLVNPCVSVALMNLSLSLSAACLTFQRSEHFLENSAKLTDCSGFFFRCSSRHVWTKNAYADVLPLGLLWSLRIIFLPANTGAYYVSPSCYRSPNPATVGPRLPNPVSVETGSWKKGSSIQLSRTPKKSHSCMKCKNICF